MFRTSSERMDGCWSWLENWVASSETDGQNRKVERSNMELNGSDMELNGSDMESNGRQLAVEESEKKKMKAEKPDDDAGDHSSGMSEQFLCTICLELVCKPVVNACGHMFCFWCIHYSMNSYKESYCPLCRRPYKYFPRVCEQLHSLLLKAFPEEYRNRLRDDYDDGDGIRSPRDADGVDSDPAMPSTPQQEATHVESLPSTSETVATQSSTEDSLIVRECQSQSVVTRLDACCSSVNLQQGVEASEKGRSDPTTETSVPKSPSNWVTASDLLCGSCTKLLYRPTVLNCGHVFCQGCLSTTEDEGGSILTCSTCGSVHPGDFPMVCLELHHYLEQNFSSGYEARHREFEAQTQELSKIRSQSNDDSQTTGASKQIRRSKSSRHSPGVHPNRSIHRKIGCDGCGMYPLVGRRFRCQACPAWPGYDLCWGCYNSGKDLVGRFDQEHTREHRVEEVLPATFGGVPANDILDFEAIIIPVSGLVTSFMNEPLPEESEFL